MRIVKSVVVMAAFAMAISATNANAKLEGVFSDWAVHSQTISGDKVCFALAKPKSKTPSSVDHGDIFFMVANWKSGAAKEQPSLLTGYALKSQIPPSARIGRAKIPMYADGSEAFVESGADEKKLVRSMRKGSTMRVDAVSARGTQISYEFSLRGITAALGKVRSVCG